MYKKALVPLDGSELAECALKHIRTMIRRGIAGQVTLLTVVNVDISWTDVGYSGYHADVEVIREEALDSAKRYLTKAAIQLKTRGIQAATALIEADRPARAITDYARDNQMDLIVIATHGRSGLKRMVLGSVASGVLNQSHVPVLLIRPESCRT